MAKSKKNTEKKSGYDKSLDKALASKDVTVGSGESAATYRVSIRSYDGGSPKVAVQAVFTRKNGEEGVSAAKRIPLEHAAAVMATGAKLAAAAMSKLASK